MIPLIGTRQHSQGSVTMLPKKKSVIVCGKSFPILLVRKQFSFRNCLLFCFSSLSGGAKYLESVWLEEWKSGRIENGGRLEK